MTTRVSNSLDPDQVRHFAKMSDFHYDAIICYIDISTCKSDSLLKLLESVISKLSFQIIWTSDFFSFFIVFKTDKSYKSHLLAKI